VQVWFPGYGWQSFDPTASVPAAAPSPGVTALRDLGTALRRVPWVPLAAVAAGVGAVVAAVRLRRRKPATWAAQLARQVERAGTRAGRPPRPSETLPEYATSLDELGGSGSATWTRLARSAEASAYGGREPPTQAQRDMLAEAKRTRVPRRRRTLTKV
jgi:hypothetical protein